MQGPFARRESGHRSQAAKRKNVQVIGQLAKTATGGGGCKSLKLNGGAEGGRTPDLRIANGFGPSLHGLSCGDIQ